METSEYDYILAVLEGQIPYFEFCFLENIYRLSRYDDSENCKKIILEKWVELVFSNKVCDNILKITGEIAYNLDCGDILCNLTPQTGKRKVLTFLHEKGYKGDAEIAFAAHNNLDFLRWMYESEMEWDDSLQFFDDIEDIKVLKFLKYNMKNWRNGKFPTINIKKAKQ